MNVQKGKSNRESVSGRLKAERERWGVFAWLRNPLITSVIEGKLIGSLKEGFSPSSEIDHVIYRLLAHRLIRADEFSLCGAVNPFRGLNIYPKRKLIPVTLTAL